MSQLTRVYKLCGISTIKKELLIYGDISGTCGACQAIDLKLDEKSCTSCHTPFKYITFRNVKSHLPKMLKITQERPEVTLIDYEDYKRNEGKAKAGDIFK